MERAELLCALFVDANDDSDLDEDELLLLAVFFSRGSVPRSLPIGRLHCAVCRLADCTAQSADWQIALRDLPCGSAALPETCM